MCLVWVSICVYLKNPSWKMSLNLLHLMHIKFYVILWLVNYVIWKLTLKAISVLQWIKQSLLWDSTTFIKVIALCIAIWSLYKLFTVQLLSNVYNWLKCNFFYFFIYFFYFCVEFSMHPIATVTALSVWLYWYDGILIFVLSWRAVLEKLWI